MARLLLSRSQFNQIKPNLKLLRHLTFVTLCLAACLPASAGVVQQTVGFSANNTSNYDSTTGAFLSDASVITNQVELARFDSSLGQLTGIEITFATEWTHYAYAKAYDDTSEYEIKQHNYKCGKNKKKSCTKRYKNFKDYENDTWVTSISDVSFTLALLEPAYVDDWLADRLITGCTDYERDGGRASCRASDYNAANAFNGALDLTGYDVGQFVGSDPLLFSLSTYAGFSAICDNNDYGDRCKAYNDAYWQGDVTVSYTYEEVAVPTPGLFLVLALGLLPALARRRR